MGQMVYPDLSDPASYIVCLMVFVVIVPSTYMAVCRAPWHMDLAAVVIKQRAAWPADVDDIAEHVSEVPPAWPRMELNPVRPPGKVRSPSEKRDEVVRAVPPTVRLFAPE